MKQEECEGGGSRGQSHGTELTMMGRWEKVIKQMDPWFSRTLWSSTESSDAGRQVKYIHYVQKMDI